MRMNKQRQAYLLASAHRVPDVNVVMGSPAVASWHPWKMARKRCNENTQQLRQLPHCKCVRQALVLCVRPGNAKQVRNNTSTRIKDGDVKPSVQRASAHSQTMATQRSPPIPANVAISTSNVLRNILKDSRPGSVTFKTSPAPWACRKLLCCYIGHSNRLSILHLLFI